MKAKHFLLVVLAVGVAPAAAWAQSNTTGAVQGQVTDANSGEKLAGVTVIATSPAMQGTQTAITDENGFYKINELPPGEYLVTFYYADLTLERNGVNVGVNKTTPVFQKLNQAAAGGEVVKIHDTAPTIDPTSTTQGITIDKSYMNNVPVPGRNFESALGAAAGSQGDGVGIAFSGSSSLENQYYVDGVNTTGLTFGTVGSPVINDFIEEIEVITGGYNAEYGRATGGVVNVVTKTGSNEFKGSVFANYQPGFLTAPAERSPVNASSIDAVADNAYRADVGFELGGPIIKDRLWFFVGFAPQFAADDITRTTKSQTDCRKTLATGKLSPCDARSMAMGGFADGTPDVDPKTGFFITDTLDSEVRQATTQAYNIITKINFAATPENQAQVTFQALPGTTRQPNIFGLESAGFQGTELTTDLSAKWTSKFNDNKTEIEAVVGWHRDHIDTDALDDMLEQTPLQGLTRGSLGIWGPAFGHESAKTNAGCNDLSSADPYPLLQDNCPMDTRFYVVGGPGELRRETEQRRSAKLAITQRVKAAGSHEIKAGIDAESNLRDKSRLYSGGAFIENFVGGQQDLRVTRWVHLLGLVDSGVDPTGHDICQTPDNSAGGATNTNAKFVCDYLSGVPGSPNTLVTSNTFNWSAYLRDSWQIQPNLTLNYGVRYEEQRLRYAGFLQNTIDPLTHVQLGKNAMTLTNMWAPRVGLLYDWTKEGRSKIYASWGRFYESIPMDINERSFGGEVQSIIDYSACGQKDPNINGYNGNSCLGDGKNTISQQQLFGASGVLITPGIKPQYLDEIVGGVEYELLDDLKIGLSYQHRTLGRVIEDVSTDGANTYILANPGEWDKSEEQKLQDRIDRVDDPKEKALLEHQLALFQGVRIFDKPRRDYDAIQLTMTRTFSKQLYVQGSYTYSRTQGNYPGLISYDNGQIDPNISSQYDLIELLANREGPLPLDRPHQLKIDGYYTWDLKKQGQLTVGARLRASSGVPENALASHYLYGPNESFLLPRGELGRTDFDHGLDMRFIYGRKIRNDMELDIFVDIFNIYDRQNTFTVDSTYAPAVRLNAPNSTSGTLQNANPVSGGTYEDLIWVKTIDMKGAESQIPIGRNPNFLNTSSRYAPAYGRVGVRLTF